MTGADVLDRLDSMVCARCDSRLVVTRDAIGRERRRCPKCDGVSQIRPHPDDAMVPQGLVRANLLPPVAAGQLRCQRCACGVEGDRRFCSACSFENRSAGVRAAAPNRVYAPKPCARCSSVFQPTGPRALFCEACR